MASTYNFCHQPKLKLTKYSLKCDLLLVKNVKEILLILSLHSVFSPLFWGSFKQKSALSLEPLGQSLRKLRQKYSSLVGVKERFEGLKSSL